MKFILPFLTVFALALVCIFPAKLIAGDKEIEFVRRGMFVSPASPMDTIPPKQIPEKKEQLDDPKRRPTQDFRREGEGIRTKDGIKEVPRSIKKLKPKPVINRIPIRRPPLRIPKKGLRGVRF